MKRSLPTTHSAALASPIFKMEAKTLEEQTRGEMLIELAIRNYSRGLIANAEHFLYLVQAMYPCDRADEFLKFIRTSKAPGTQQGNSTNTLDNLIDSVQCLEITTEENLNKRSRLKAKRAKLEMESKSDFDSESDSQSESDPESEHVTDFRNASVPMVNNVSSEVASNVLTPSSNGVALDNEEEMEDLEEIEDVNETAAERITRALNSLLLRKYNVADKVLGRAYKLFPKNELISSLHKQVRKEVEIIKKNAPGKEHELEKADFYAAKYIFLAVQAKDNKDFNTAIMLCQVAEKWQDTQDSRKAYVQILKEKLPMDKSLIYKYAYTSYTDLTQYGTNLHKAESLYYDKKNREAEKELRKLYHTALPEYVVQLKKLICAKIEAEDNVVFDDEEEMEDNNDIEDTDKTAAERIETALNSLLLKDYNVADKVLGRAYKSFPTDELICGLRKQVKKEIKILKEIATRKECNHPNADYYAAEYIFLAILAKNDEYYDSAISLCQLAEKWHDSDASRKTYTRILKEKLPLERKLVYQYANTNFTDLTQYGIDLQEAESLYYDKKNKEAEKCLRKCYLTALPKYVVELKKLISSKIDAEDDDDDVIIIDQIPITVHLP